MPDRLPVEDCLPRVIEGVGRGQPVILRAPPGAGKTTGVPPAILNSGHLSGGKVLLLQPRRLAARAAAHRLSKLAGQRVGETYGYHVRFDRKVSARTRVIAMTTGILLRQLTADPLLDDVDAVILDEFHERSLETDLVLGMLHRIRTTLRDELRIVVMSATLETQPVESLLNDAAVIESHGRAFEVAIRYNDSTELLGRSRDDIARSVADCVPQAIQSSEGDILVFLPGVGEIHRCAELLGELSRQNSIQICKLYGDLSPTEQDRVLAPSSERKLVLATNVAETSVTIPGVTCVIDTGLVRSLRYQRNVGIPALQLGQISKASADQRAGRAGRTAPGVCYRLWQSAMHRSRPDHTPPEIARADLSSALLTLASWGERDVQSFPWVTAPNEVAVETARRMLMQLGAIDDSNSLTELGATMVSLPLHPRLSRLLIAANGYGCIDAASIAAALLSERDPIDRSSHSVAGRPMQGRDRGRHPTIESDLIDRVERVSSFLGGSSDPAIHRGGAKNIERVSESLRRMMGRESNTCPETNAIPLDEALTRSMLAAFPDRLAKRRSAGSPSGLMVGGRGVRLDRSSMVRSSELFLCIDLDGKGEESLVRLASGVEEAWLPRQNMRVVNERFFHPNLKSVVARERTYFEDLLIAESPGECDADEETGRMLFENAIQDLGAAIPKRDKALESLLARWEFLDDHGGSERLPCSIDKAIREVLEQLCRSRTSFKELNKAPWLQHLQGLLSYDQSKWMDEEAPEAILVPSGNRIRVEYRGGARPILAVRIQEVFGWSETPRLAGGRVPLQLHLLGPNHRPQQITDDLKSFWQTTYTEVRKELKRRYAKHHWPDDPWSATATRNGLKPRK